MFVSSYNTYINTNNSNKNTKTNVEKENLNTKSFNSQLLSKTKTQIVNQPAVPVDYISKSLVFSNKQQVEQQLSKSPDQTKSKIDKFKGQSTLISAKDAYTSNSKMFSLFIEPHATMSQTPKIDSSLPDNLKELKEQTIRHQMVNTYIENDTYYKITA